MSQDKQFTDAELVQLSLKENSYFAQIVERYEKKLYSYIRQITRLDHHSIEDVLQEVFIKIYRNLNAFDQSLSFNAWAYRIAHNESISYLRRNREHVSLDEPDSEDDTKLIDILPSELDLASEVSRNDLSLKIREAIYSLSEDYRDVIVLRYIEDYSYDEISDILQKPSGTIATLLNRAKSQLKTILQKNNITSL